MPTAHAKALNRRIFATWSGGAYVDLHWDTPSSTPFEVINVWDDDVDRAAVGQTEVELRVALEEWIEETGPEELQNYFDHTHPAGRYS